MIKCLDKNRVLSPDFCYENVLATLKRLTLATSFETSFSAVANSPVTIWRPW